MDYVEHAAPAALRHQLQCVWILHDIAPGAGVQAVYPDGRCELIAHFAAPMRLHHLDGRSQVQAATLFAGQQRGPIRLQAQGAVHCLGVRLAPAASALVAGSQLAALRDEIVGLETIEPQFAARFAAAARAFALQRDADGLWELLASRVHESDPAIELAVAMLDESRGDSRIAPLANASAMSLRGFQTRFLASVGMTAKEYARVRRLQAALHALDQEAAPIAQIAVAHGYADQAHATRELGRLTGTTPARLMRALRNHRDGDETLRLAAAFVRGRT